MGTLIYDAAVAGDLEQVQAVVARSPEAVNEKDEYGFTALHGLAGEEHYDIVRFLIEHGADVNAQNEDGITPLHLAAWPEMAEFLITSGADLEARTHGGDTPLMVMAAETESEDVMEVLLEAGADVNARNNQGRTAYDIAKAREETDKMKLLKRYGHQ
ncbi:MAG TPA: ankyrin repeat domain-containing protein [Bacillota bacterium]